MQVLCRGEACLRTSANNARKAAQSFDEELHNFRLCGAEGLNITLKQTALLLQEAGIINAALIELDSWEQIARGHMAAARGSR